MDEKSQILQIGKTLFPQQSDEEILQGWNELKAEDPTLTPKHFAVVLEFIMEMAQEENQMAQPVGGREDKMAALQSLRGE
jgi:hypothetical protein